MEEVTEVVLTFGPATSKAKKTWMFALTASKELNGCSAQLIRMIKSAHELKEGFTLEQLAEHAYNNGMECKVKSNLTPDFGAIGYTHRPRLMEMGIIKAEV